MNDIEKRELRNKGFLKWEVEQFENGNINFESHTFQSMVRSRKLWIDAMRMVGWNDTQIAVRLRHWYRIKKERNPFDWLKMEYRPPIKLTIKQLAQQLAIRRSASRVLGRAYGRIRSIRQLDRIGYKGIPKPK